MGPSRRKSQLRLKKESFLSKSACHEQWTGIRTPGPGDCRGRDTGTMGERMGWLPEEMRWQFHSSVREEIPGAEYTAAQKAEIWKAQLKPSE